jgi:hypothetical protein
MRGWYSPCFGGGSPTVMHRDARTTRLPLRRPHVDQIHVVIVSDNEETLDGLQAYLRGAGISARGMRFLPGRNLAHHRLTAVVLFPDDFAWVDIADEIARLVRVDVLLILVTRDPGRFELLIRQWRGIKLPIVIPKPAWGWTILDLILDRLEA